MSDLLKLSDMRRDVLLEHFGLTPVCSGPNPLKKETPMYQTTVTITRDDILQGEEWVATLVEASVPKAPRLPSAGSTYFSKPGQSLEHVAFTVKAISPDRERAIIETPDRQTEQLELLVILDRLLAGELYE